ncbi:MAG: cyclic nucleotide-binding domain-containing protein [Myxococcota bacterium]
MMRIVDVATTADPSGVDAVVVTQAPAIVGIARGLGGPGVAERASALAAAAIDRKAALLDKLARATETDRRSGARLALIRALERLFGEIHAELSETSGASGSAGIGATLALAVISAGYAHLAHVGATRAYLWRDGRLRALTDDHTLGMVRVRQGSMSPAEYRDSALRQRLYQALGTGIDVDVDAASVGLADRDVVVLCSDAIHAALDEAAITAAVQAETAQAIVDGLAERARAAGADGPLSAVAVRIAADGTPEELDAVARTLAQCALFHDLTDAERLLVAPYLDHLDLDTGGVMFSEGDPADAFYVIVDGAVRVTRSGTPLTEIGAGGSLGELCLAGPGITRSATVTATAPTVALGLTRDRFHEVVGRRPNLGARLLVRSLQRIGDRLRDLTERLASVEKLAVGETKPGDLALRTAIVLAARGEWPNKE